MSRKNRTCMQQSGLPMQACSDLSPPAVRGRSRSNWRMTCSGTTRQGSIILHRVHARFEIHGPSHASRRKNTCQVSERKNFFSQVTSGLGPSPSCNLHTSQGHDFARGILQSATARRCSHLRKGWVSLSREVGDRYYELPNASNLGPRADSACWLRHLASRGRCPCMFFYTNFCIIYIFVI